MAILLILKSFKLFGMNNAAIINKLIYYHFCDELKNNKNWGLIHGDR